MPSLLRPRTAPFLLLALALGAGLSLTACGEDEDDGAGRGQAQAAGATVTLDDDGGEVTIASGDRLDVVLEVGGGTGYQWRADDLGDGTVLRAVSGDHRQVEERGESDEPMVGAPEEDVFTFEGAGAGSETLTVRLFPPAGDEAEETFTVTVVVEG